MPQIAVIYMEQPLKLDYLRAALCILGVVYFIFPAWRYHARSRQR